MSMVTGVNQDQLYNALLAACEEHGAGVPDWYVPAEARSNLHFAVVAMTTANGFAGAPHVLHYVSADGPGPDATWSVYRELYVTADAEVPIDGSQVFVSTHTNEAEAEAEARRLQGSEACGEYDEATGGVRHCPKSEGHIGDHAWQS